MKQAVTVFVVPLIWMLCTGEYGYKVLQNHSLKFKRRQEKYSCTCQNRLDSNKCGNNHATTKNNLENKIYNWSWIKMKPACCNLFFNTVV